MIPNLSLQNMSGHKVSRQPICKRILRIDEFAGGNYEGIKTMHIADFLLSSEY